MDGAPWIAVPTTLAWENVWRMENSSVRSDNDKWTIPLLRGFSSEKISSRNCRDKNFLPSLGDTRFVNKITVHHPPPGDHQFSLCWFDITSTKSSPLITLFHEIYFRKFSWNVSFIRDEYNKQASIFEKRKREKNFLIELKSSCTKDNNGARFSRVHWRHACPAFVYTVSVSFYRQPVRFHECAVTFHK